MAINLNGHEQPVNKMAAMSYSKGVTFEPRFKSAKVFDIHPETYPFLGHKKDNLTGTKYSKLTIIGYLGKSNKKRGCLWLAKCVCGKYTVCRTKAIKKPGKENVYQCDVCNQTSAMLRKYNKGKKKHILNLAQGKGV